MLAEFSFILGQVGNSDLVFQMLPGDQSECTVGQCCCGLQAFRIQPQ